MPLLCFDIMIFMLQLLASMSAIGRALTCFAMPALTSDNSLQLDYLIAFSLYVNSHLGMPRS